MCGPDRCGEEELWTRLAGASGRDKIEILLELSHLTFQRSDFRRASTLLREVVDVAVAVGDRRIEADALHALGSAAFNLADLPGAAEFYLRAVDAYLDAGANAQAASSMLNAAEAYHDLGDLEQCVLAATRVQGLAEEAEEWRLAGDACHLQTRCHWRLGEIQPALAAWTSGREHFTKAAVPRLVAQIDDLAVVILLEHSDTRRALKVARGALKLAEGIGLDVASARMRLAQVRHRRGQHVKALKGADAAMSEFRRADDLSGVAQCEWLRAQALFGVGKSAQALSAFEQAHVLLEASGQSRDALRCRRDHAVTLHALGKYAKAARINKQLMRVLTESAATTSEAQWCAVRLLENLSAQHKYQAVVARAEEYANLWQDGVTAQHLGYRQLLAVWSFGLFRVGRHEYARAMAAHVLNNTTSGMQDCATGFCLEVRAVGLVDTDPAAAVCDLAGAVAAYLAVGETERAQQTARYMDRVRRPLVSSAA